MIWEFLATTLLPALIPAAVDGVKSGISMLTGNKAAQPQTFTDLIEYEKLGIEKLKALSELDKVEGEISRWVANLRASARYIAVFIILVWHYALQTLDIWWPVTSGALDQSAALAQAAVFFLLGDRVWMGIKGQAKK